MAGLVNSAVTLMAGLICTAQAQGDDLAAGAGTARPAWRPHRRRRGVELHRRLAAAARRSVDGRPTYRIAIAGMVGNTPVDIVAVHSPAVTRRVMAGPVS